MNPNAKRTPNPSEATDPTTVRIDHDSHDTWLVSTPELPEPVACRTLSEAKRLAYHYAGRQRPCELIVCDAYHRVLYREHINDSSDRRTRARRERDAADSD